MERNVVINIVLLRARKSSLEKRNKPKKQKIQIKSLNTFHLFFAVAAIIDF